MKRKLLPKTILIEVAENVDLDSTGADLLSDLYGFCVNQFNYERVGTKVKFYNINWDYQE